MWGTFVKIFGESVTKASAVLGRFLGKSASKGKKFFSEASRVFGRPLKSAEEVIGALFSLPADKRQRAAKSVLILLMADIGVEAAVSTAQELLSNSDGTVPSSTVHAVNEFIDLAKQVQNQAVTFDRVYGTSLSKADGDDVLSHEDVVTTVKLNKDMINTYESLRRSEVEVMAGEYRRMILQLNNLSRLLGLSNKDTLKVVRLLKEVDSSYEALINENY